MEITDDLHQMQEEIDEERPEVAQRLHMHLQRMRQHRESQRLQSGANAMMWAQAITIPSNLLEGIFDECDKYETEETGGRLLGFYEKKTGIIEVRALLGPGPRARRTQTSFFQDGEYQEKLFRSIEQHYPDIRHLGNWHTHHVNGLETLSRGDVETYTKIVNHKNHAQDFFYALLVTKRILRGRYATKHFIFFRGEDVFVEVDSRQVHITKPSILEI